MKPSDYVSLHYKMIPDGSMNIYIDQVYNLVGKLKKSKDFFEVNPFLQDVSCNIILYTSQGSREFHVYLESKEKDKVNERLTRAITSFVQIAGTPNFVAAGSNYDAVEEAIKYDKKTLKRKFYDFGAGKHVVDLEDKINNSEEIFSEV